jgi:hypothetical protein
MMTAELKPWDRRPDESDPAWEAFVEYRDLGAARSLAKVAQRLLKSKTLVTRWSARYDWRERVEAYDASLDQVRQTATEETLVDMAARHATQAQAMQELARSALAEIQKRIQSGESCGMTARDAIRTLVEGIRLERQARGAPEVIEPIAQRDELLGHALSETVLYDEEIQAAAIELTEAAGRIRDRELELERRPAGEEPHGHAVQR